jgi:hypothetical protein
MSFGGLARVVGYAGFLADEEQATFSLFHQQLSSAATRYQRNRRFALAADQIRAAHTYCVRGDDNDWRRFLACGICWISPFRIAVHVKQFALLIGKSKSSVNGVLTKLGYVMTPTRPCDVDRLSDLIPYLRNDPRQLRHWAIRQTLAPQGHIAGLSTDEDTEADADPTGDGDDLFWESVAGFVARDESPIDWYAP